MCERRAEREMKNAVLLSGPK
uniref:Uncharacterized protein n=1 Tax=Anopheles dirus TaxID=7168 RepID=A0A182NWT2_9DIPT